MERGTMGDPRTGSLARRALLCAALLPVLAGCAVANARLQRSQAVFDDFRGATVRAGYTYYTTGVENNPDAILGIADGYTLRTERWMKRDMTPELLRYLVGRMDDEFAAIAGGLAGSAVLNEGGEEIGIWYSSVDITRVEMLSDTEVRVSPPTLMELDKRKTEKRK